MTEDRQHCPDTETLGAFMDGSLPEEQALAMAAHISNCDDCLFIAGEAAAFREDETPAPAIPLPVLRPRQSWRKGWMAVAAVAAIAVIAIPLLTTFADPVHALVAAAPTRSRNLEPRLTGGFRWAPLKRLRGTDSDGPIDPDEYKLQGTAGEILENATRHPSLRRRHAAGVANLLIEEPTPAVEKLQAATTADPNNARYWSDLGAAYFAASEHAETPSSQLDLARAALEKARALDPRLPEAQFNLALTLERMELRDQAIEEWKHYLALDPNSKWAAEARERHLQRLTAQ